MNFPDIPQELEATLLQLLQQQTWQEHALLKRLEQQGYSQFAPSLDTLELFQAHFLLFHILYRLQDKWRSNKIGELSIFTLAIQLDPFIPFPSKTSTMEDKASVDLTSRDELKAYYLDFSAYRNTQAQEVQNLLDQFWEQLQKQPLPHQIEQALTLFKLDTPFNQNQLTQRYRQLAQKHHPDKGGETNAFQNITHHYHLLKNWLTQC